MINLDQCDPLCIYSTLRFVVSQAQFYNVTPVLTFGRPLYWKVLTIIQSQPNGTELNQIVLQPWGIPYANEFLGKHTEFPRLDALHVLDASALFNAGCSGRQTFETPSCNLTPEASG